MEKISSSIISTAYKASYAQNILQTGREHTSGNAKGYTLLQNTVIWFQSEVLTQPNYKWKYYWSVF
jgi:hypothetical protein